VTGQPYEAEVRAYLADCRRHRAQLDTAYHPTADGAVKMIPHGGRTEGAGQIRQVFAALAGTPAHRFGHQGQKGTKARSGLTFEAAALGYIGHGWPVFVLGRSKRPVANCHTCRTAGPGHDRARCGCLTCHGFYAATLNPARLAGMLRKIPGGLLAIRTGTASGLCVVDIDPRNGGQLDRTLMTPTATVATGGGGWHLYYRHPGGPTLPALPGAAGIDIKSDGGYVAAPPSIHPGTGRRYRWVGGRGVAEMPPALRAALTPPPVAAPAPAAPQQNAGL